MTVTAEAAATGVDRVVVDQQFTDIYAECYERLRKHIYYRNHLTLTDLAEDFTQETFIELYRKLLKGETFEHPYGLLCCIATRVVGTHLKVKRNTAFTAIDLGDPVNTPIIATGHAYAPEAPELAATAAELDAAMDVMTEASRAWRNAHQEKHMLRQLLRSDEKGTQVLHPERRECRRQQLAAAEALEPSVLARFKEACRQVGALRGELERAGGANYRSSAGMPASAMNAIGRAGSVTSDISITHCLAGHALHLDNVSFGENGTRRCRACVMRNTAASQSRKSKETKSSNQAQQLALVSA